MTEKLGPDGLTQIKGLAVDIAARIEGLAKPGQVLMSAAVYQSARQRLGVEAFGQPIVWQAYGDYSLKGFDQPIDIGEAGLEGVSPLEAPTASEKAYPVVATRVDEPEVEIIPPPRKGVPRWVMAMGGLGVVVVALIAALAYVLGQQRAVAPEIAMGSISTLAVLPFENYSGDAEQEFFVDGMTDMLTAELSKLSSLTVKARTSAMRYKDTDKSLSEIARELDVQVLVEGSVFRSGDEVRITAQLVRGDTEEHLWGDNYRGAVADALQLQSDVALDIVEQIHAAITPGERDRIAEIQTENSAALDEYLRGRYFWNKRTPDGLEKAIQHFELATQLDPNYAEAYAGLAETYAVLPNYMEFAVSRALDKVQETAARALELDGSLAPAHAALGFAQNFYEWNWAAAEDSFRRAIELDPNHPTSRQWYSSFLDEMGRHEEAVREMQTALRLDPVSLIINEQLGGAWRHARDYDRAVAQLNSALEMDPNFKNSLLRLSFTYLESGRLQEAWRTVERLGRASEGTAFEPKYLEVSGLLQVREGGRTAAENTLTKLTEIAAEHEEEGDSVSGIRRELVPLATINIALGNIDVGFEWLERAFENRVWHLPSELVLPQFDLIRSDPRFHSLLRRMNYPEDAIERLTEPLDNADAPIEKIAVLPFINMTGDLEQEYFVDGMTEALITELAQIKALQVRGRTSIMRYKNTTLSIPEIARELDVDGIIEGSVLRDGDQVRITAQLIHGPSDTHRWARSFDSELTSILKLHSDMALAIVKEVQANLSPQEEGRLTQARNVNPRAYDERLKGDMSMNEQSESGYLQARAYYTRAIEIDPEYAEPYAYMGISIWASSIWGWSDAHKDIEEAKTLTRKALDLDDRSSNAHVSAGWIALGYDYDWERAEIHFRKSVELSPETVMSNRALSWSHLMAGRYDKAIRAGVKAGELDPFSPDALDSLADAYSMSSQYEKAIARRVNILELAPDHAGTLSDLTDDYLCAGLYDDALAAYRRLLAVRGEDADAGLATVLAFAGHEEEARALLEREVARSAEEFVSALRVTLAYVALGETEAALTWLERAYEQRPWRMIEIDDWLAPLFAPIRDEPRFQAILEKMKFPRRGVDND